ncbi:stage III sporulation protein AE [Numidum massiliense]|uniref:stage III sporulation protein AE n=1 Tax=Numidum massiliense TaxID=1522315 RepID=UPI00093AB67A|nr:stage III sporulation protein AE [Numidum massiliense]
MPLHKLRQIMALCLISLLSLLLSFCFGRVAVAEAEKAPERGARVAPEVVAETAQSKEDGERETSRHEEQTPQASLQNEWVKKQLEALDTGPIESFWQQIYDNYDEFLPENSGPSLVDLVLRPGEGFSFKEALTGFIKYFFYEIAHSGKLLTSIAMLALFCTVLQHMQAAFEQNAVSKVAYAVAYLVLIILAVNSFTVAFQAAQGAISAMVNFMLALVPLVLTLLGAMGGIATVAVMHPIVVFLVHFIGTAVYTVLFPLLFFSAVLGIVSAYTDKFPLTNLAKLLRNVSMSALGIFLTVFLGVVSVQGTATAVTDGVTIRTAKYVTGTFVPVVGGMFADAADTVVGASLLVKNALGMTGVIILLLICAFPAIKILVLALVYNVTGAVMQPLGDSPIINCLDVIGKSLILIFAAMATVGLMFFIALTIIIASGNVSVMMR